MTKVFLEQTTKKNWEEAFASDPHGTEGVTRAVLGRDIFVWHLLTIAELHELGRRVLALCLMARG